jgi:hypothetical protein
VIYRCKLCGLELTFSNEANKLIVATPADAPANVPPKIPA